MFVQKFGVTSRSGTRGLASALLSRTEKDWVAKSANDLRREAKARGLSQSGSKVQIARRLMKAEQQTLQSAPTPIAPAAEVQAVRSSPASGSRQFGSSAKYNLAVEATSTKFTPRRPYTLNIKIPEEVEPVEEGATVVRVSLLVLLPQSMRQFAHSAFAISFVLWTLISLPHIFTGSANDNAVLFVEPSVIFTGDSTHHTAAKPIQQPFLPDYFQSHHSQSASPIQEPPAFVPRVITVASAATHEGGGPSSSMWGAATDAHLQEVHGDGAAVHLSGSGASADAAAVSGQNTAKGPGIFADFLEDLGFGGGLKLLPLAPVASLVAKIPDTSSATEAVKEAVEDVRSAVSNVIATPTVEEAAKDSSSKSSRSEPLKPEERQGLYALAGLVSAGYVLSKVFA